MKDPAVLTASNHKCWALGNRRCGVRDDRDVAFGTPVDTCRPSANVGGGVKELEWTCAAHIEIF